VRLLAWEGPVIAGAANASKRGLAVNLRAIVIGAVAIQLLAAGCASGPREAPSGSALATETTESTPSTPSSSPSVPVPDPSPTARPPLEWTRLAADPGLADVRRIRAGVAFGERLVIVGDRSADHDHQPGVWYSDDGSTWHRADVEDEDSGIVELFDVTVGGPGLVAVGAEYNPPQGQSVRAAVWTSPDGATWNRVPSPPGFFPGRMRDVGATEQGVVAFAEAEDLGGYVGPVIWTSPDGVTWLRPTNETGLQVAAGIDALLPVDGGLKAFVGSMSSFGPPRRADMIVEIWETNGRAEWQKVGDLAGSAGAKVIKAARGPAGWVALGMLASDWTPLAWTSPDGVSWQRASNAPAVHNDIVAHDGGFLAVGGDFERGAGTWPTMASPRPDKPCQGLETWLSADGLVWELSPAPQTSCAAEGMIVAFQRDDQLVGVGLSLDPTYTSSSPGAAVWTMPLPGVR
jgi:hypothetical protein